MVCAWSVASSVRLVAAMTWKCEGIDAHPRDRQHVEVIGDTAAILGVAAEGDVEARGLQRLGEAAFGSNQGCAFGEDIGDARGLAFVRDDAVGALGGEEGHGVEIADAVAGDLAPLVAADAGVVGGALHICGQGGEGDEGEGRDQRQAKG